MLNMIAARYAAEAFIRRSAGKVAHDLPPFKGLGQPQRGLLQTTNCNTEMLMLFKRTSTRGPFAMAGLYPFKVTQGHRMLHDGLVESPCLPIIDQ